MAAEISMDDGTTKFVTTPSTTAESLRQDFERHGLVEVHLTEDRIVYVNPSHVAYIREA